MKAALLTTAVPKASTPRAAVLTAAALTVAVFFPGVGTASAAESPDLSDLVGIERLGAWYEQHPEAKETKSSGWKPYNREVWLRSHRTAPEGAAISQLRYEAFLEARAKESLSGQRGEPGWFSIGPVEYSGRCVALDFDPTDPNTVYVGSAGGGLWKTTDGGDSWSTSTDDLPTLAVGAICVLPSDPNVVLIGTGEGAGTGFVTAGKGIFGFGLLKSTDAGATWNSTSLSYSIPSAHGFNVIEDNPLTGTLLAGANDGLWRSVDDGDTWTQIANDGNYFDVKWKPGDPNTVYVAKGRDPFVNSQTDNGVYVSNDDGLTFALAGTGQPNPGLIAKTKIAVTAADPDYIYAHYISTSGYGTLGIYRSTDGGQTWQLRNSSINMAGGQGWYNNVIAVDPNDPDRVVAGGNVLYLSSDGGSSFVDLNSSIPFGDGIAPHWDNHALAYEPGSTNSLWIATDGGPWRSVDDGATWTRRTEGIITYQFYDIGVAQSDPLFVMGGTQDNGMPGRADEDSWFHSTFIADGFVCNIDPADASVVYSEWQGGNHIKSLDGGQNWFGIQNGIFGSGAWLTPVDMDQADSDRLWTSTTSGIFRTTNGGSNWSRVGTQRADWISANPSNADFVWTVSNVSGAFYSNDGGDSWTQSVSFPGSGLAIKIQADPSNVASAFVVFGGYATGGPHIIRTTNSGISWLDVTGDFPDQPANTFVVDPELPNHWYVGSDVGVWRSTDGGATWLPYGSGLVNALIADLEIRRDERKLVAGSYGRGVWEIDLPAGTSSVDGSGPDGYGPDGNGPDGSPGGGGPDGNGPGGSDGVAGPFGASQNLMLDPPYPNPVSGEATLRFAARSDLPVNLELYDVSGRLVDTVVQGARGDGVIRMVSWSARSLPDGVYLMKLTSGNEQVTRKVLVSR